MDQPLTLDPAPQDQTPKIDIYPDTPNVPKEGDALSRSLKYHYTLGDQSPGLDSVYQKIISGQEDQLRDTQAMQKSLADKQYQDAHLRAYMASHTGPITDQALEKFKTLTVSPTPNANVDMEKSFSEKIINDLYPPADKNSLAWQAHDQDPEGTSGVMAAIKNHVANQEIVRKTLEDSQSNWKNQNWFIANKFGNDKLEDLAETLIPFKPWYDIVSASASGKFFLGANLADVVRQGATMPTSEFQPWFKAQFDAINAHNPLDAQHFAQAFISYGTSDEAFDTGGNILDTAGVVIPSISPALKALKGGLKITSQILTKAKDFDIPSLISSAGKTLDAAKSRVLRDFDSNFARYEGKLTQIYESDPSGEIKKLIEGSPTFDNPIGFTRGGSLRESSTPTALDREFTTRLNDILIRDAFPAIRTLIDRNAVERLGVDAQQAAVDRAVQVAQGPEFGHLGNGIVDLHEVLLPENNPANIGQVALYLKRPDALPFQSAASADHYANTIYKLLPGDFRIENQGNDWYIKVIRPWDETNPNIRDQLIPTGNTTPRKYFGLLRSSDEINPMDVRTGKKAVVHGIQDQYRTINDLTQPIRNLRGQSKRDFIRFTEALRDFQGPNGERGRLFHTLRELETEWQNMFNRLPNEKEVLAYHGYLKAYEWDHIWRNLGVYRSLNRQGVLDISLAKGTGASTEPFKSRIVDNINFDRNDGILLHDGSGSPMFFRGHFLGAAERQALEVSISNGELKVLQLASPQTLPLKTEFGINDLVEFVITKDFNAKRITPIQIPFRPVYPEYAEPFSITQPRAMHAGTRYIYTHDTNVRKVNISTDAASEAEHYNEAQRLYRLRDPSFDNYTNTHLPHPGAQRLREAFDQGHLSSTEPFVVTRKGENAWDLNEVKNHYQGTGVEPYHINPNNLYQTVSREHTGDLNVDPTSGNGRGNVENPLFPLSQPKYIDPLTTINRAAATTARNTYLEDFRLMAAEHFVQEFAPVLKMSTDELRNNPLAAIFTDKFNENAPRDTLMAAKNYQQSFKNFLYTRTDWDRNRGWMKEKMYEWTAQHIGEARADAISNNKLLGFITDPVHFVRSVAFTEHLSLFNPSQYFKQLQTLTHITGIAGPVIAGKSVPAAYFMRALMMNIADRPGMIDHFAGMASKFGWDTEHFKEAYLAIRRSGLDLVEGEHSWKDDLTDPKLFQGQAGQWLDKSAIFFREGERLTRLSAFNAAYLQWREVNPLATLDRRAVQYILTRQDLMNGNMTRASNAAWQSMGRGILSVPLQFSTYPIRIMEQFIGDRLTKTEKARLFLTYSTMYGIPVGLGITPLGVYPFYQDLQKGLLERGITADPNIIVETLHKGIIETLTHMISGKENNAGESLGVGGLQITKDMFNGQFLDVALGASGSTVGGIINSMYPIYQDFAAIFHEGVDHKGPLLTQDFTDALRNISSVNAISKMYYAINYSKYISRGETYVTDMTPFDAVLSSVFGINPQDMDNLSREVESSKDLKASQQAAEQQMIKYIRRGLDTPLNDDKTRNAYFRQAETWRVLGDIPIQNYSSILQRAAQGKESLAKAINDSFFWKNAPVSQIKQRQDAYINMQGNK